MDKARGVLLDVGESIARAPITADELQRARTQWLNGWEQTFTDPENVGLALSEAIAMGDWRLFFLGRDQVQQVTLADVQRVAEAYLRPSNRTLGMYLPTDAPQRAPAPAKAGHGAARWRSSSRRRPWPPWPPSTPRRPTSMRARSASRSAA